MIAQRNAKSVGAEATTAMSCDRLSKRFGGILAVSNFTIDIPANKLVALVGPNGAGKSTLINLISGFIKPDHGRCFLFGKNITGLAPYRIARAGLVRTFQHVRLVPDRTVIENIVLAYQ